MIALRPVEAPDEARLYRWRREPEVVAGNETALKAQAAAGFRREGYMRRHAFKHGQEFDVVLLAVFAEEWAERRGAVFRSLRASGLVAGEPAPARTAA